MSLFQTLLQAVQSWRRRRGGPKTRKRTGIDLERLDHRQLLSVNFTGNVITDFPATQSPGVVVLHDNPQVIHPQIPPILQNLVKVSGLDINGIRLTYTPSDDTLSIGLEQPLSQQATHPGPVIAGDTDNNGNSATVNPAVQALEPGFIDFADLGGSETMGAFLSLLPDGLPTVVAGISNGVGQPKTYQVSQAVVNPMMPEAIPGFGTSLPANTGNVYLVNDPAHPNFEFAINHFSQLYLAETGHALTPNTTFQVGGFGNSDDDDGISEAFFPGQTVRFGDLIAPNPCPPVSPPVLINPHLHRHINTAHPSDIRVNIFGTSGFDVTKIIPGSVHLGGATPIFSFTRNINRDQFPDATFVFRGTDVQLPPGIINAEVTGTLTDGTTFDSATQVFNRDASFYSPTDVAQQQARWAARGSEGTVIPSPDFAAAHGASNVQVEDPSVSFSPLTATVPTTPTLPTMPSTPTLPTPPTDLLHAIASQQQLRKQTQRQTTPTVHIPASRPLVNVSRPNPRMAAMQSADAFANSLAQ